MGYIISINGNDGSGKTTQISILKKNSSKNTFFPPDIAEYGVFPNLSEKEFFEWWFFNSTIEEFCTAIYNGIQYRNEDIARQCKPISFLDKGIDTFDSRILANFLCRGMDETYTIQKMNAIKEKIGIQDNESIKIFLLSNSDIDERLRISKNRKGTLFGQTYYDKYQKKLNEIIEKQIQKGTYTIVNASGSIEDVNNKIIYAIKQDLLNQTNRKYLEERY